MLMHEPYIARVFTVCRMRIDANIPLYLSSGLTYIWCLMGRTIIHCLCCSFLLLGVGAQLNSSFANVPRDDQFVAITSANESVGAVYDVLQDEQGVIWVGTDKGLLRYDGNALISTLDVDPEATWLDGVVIHALQMDSQGRVWVIYEEGIAFWNKASRSFEQLAQVPGKQSTVILEQRKDHYWIGTEDGLYFFDTTSPEDQTLERLVFVNEQQNRRNLNFITALFLDKDARLWVGAAEGVYVLDTETRQIQEVFSSEAKVPTPYISFIEQDVSGGIWLGTRENGLIRVGRPPTDAEGFVDHIEYISDLPSPQLLSVQENRDGEFYIGTANNGFFLWDPISMKISEWSLYHLYDNENVFWDGARVFSLFIDRTGLLWLGTDSGLFRSASRPVFSLHSALSDTLQALNVKHVKSITHDVNGYLWIGSFGEGVVRFDERGGDVVHFKSEPDNANALIDDRVLAIDVDKDLNVWILTSGGISRFDLATSTFSSYLESNAVSITDENIIFQDIFVSEANEVLVTTSFNGLLKYNALEDSFEEWPFFLGVDKDPARLEIRQIIEDQSDMLLFAAGKGGLLKYDPLDQSFSAIHDTPDSETVSLNGMDVVSITQASNSDLWVGTAQGGVFRIEADGAEVVQYTRRDGLPGNEVTCIIEDSEGYIWIAVRGGVARYDPDQETLTRYNEHDGLRSTQFYYNSCLLSENKVLLGNNIGVEVLDLDEVSTSTPRPVVQLASIHVLNTPVHLADAQQSIQLERDNNHIRFQFFVPDYLEPAENKLMYQLSGVDEQWRPAETDNVITLSDLAPGTYQLFVKGANHRGIWSEPKIYSIQVASMRWLLLGGVGITGLLILGGLGGMLFLRSKYQGKIKELEEENLALQDESHQSVERTKAEIARDLHDDLGADLSRLVLSLENRLQREDLSDFSLSWTRECWAYAQRVTREVRFLSWSVDPDRNWLPDLVDRIYREAHDTFDVDKIQFLTSRIPHIHLPPAVRKNIFLIFRESLTNIINHASAQKIRIHISYKKRMLEIVVEDDGIGFDVEKIVEGNGLSNMRKRASDLKANLFWESKRGNGTRVLFQYLVE